MNLSLPKRILLILLVLTLLFSVVFYISYVNERTYSLLERIDGIFVRILDISLLSPIHVIVNELDIYKYILKLLNPLDDEDYVDLIFSIGDLKNNREQLDAFIKMGYIRDDMKKWRKADIIIDGVQDSIEYKFHGTSISPYIDGQFSLKIKHFKEGQQYLDNMRRFNLIVASECNSLMIAINKIASDFGLIAPYGRLVILRVNGVVIGPYCLVENHKKEWMERKYGITNYCVLRNNDDWTIKNKSPHNSDLDLNPCNIEIEGPSIHKDVALGKYEQLVTAINHNDIKRIKELVEIDYFARFLAVGAMFNDSHFISGDNLRYFYDLSKGLFYPLFRQESIGEPVTISRIVDFNEAWFQHPQYGDAITTKIFKLLLSDPEIRLKRDQYLWQLIKNKNEITNNIAQTVNVNRPVMLHSNYSRRLDNHQYEIFKQNLNKITKIAENYITYSKVYVTIEADNNNPKHVNVVNDSYIPVSISEITYDVKNGKDITTTYIDKTFSGVIITKDFKEEYSNQSLLLHDTEKPIKSIKFVNDVTGKSIHSDNVYINFIKHQPTITRDGSFTTLKDNNLNYDFYNDTLTIHKGVYKVTSDVVLPFGTYVIIEPGTILKMGGNVSFNVRGQLKALGVRGSEIRVVRLDNNKAFGSFAVTGDGTGGTAEFDYFIVKGGSESIVDGVQYTGQLAVHNMDCTINNSIFEGSISDDGVNIKYGDITIRNSSFIRNYSDQVDLDYCNGSVINCDFISSELGENGDGLDLSGSKIFLSECRFSGFKDKGLSVGEISRITLHDNKFTDNISAVTIKDQSVAYSYNNQFFNNNVNYSLYIKKQFYDAPILYVPTNLDSSLLFVDEGKIEVLSLSEIIQKGNE